VSSKSNKAFSLLEVLITVAILSTAIIFIFRSFTASLSAVRFSQDITLACYLAEDKFWEMKQKQKKSIRPLNYEQGTEELQGRQFNWVYQTSKLEDSDLIKLQFDVSWRHKIKEKEYTITFLTYLPPNP